MVEKTIVSDSVTVQFSVEEAIISDTVKVILGIGKVISDGTSFDLRATLRTIVDVPWEISNVHRFEDNGLDRITAIASARIADSEAATLPKKLRDMSKSGLKIEVTETDYSPERNKIEATKITLRESIYKFAQEEANRLNKIVSGEATKWRVGNIDFGRNSDEISPKIIRSAAYESLQLAASSPPGGGDGSIDIAYKVGLTAQARLTRVIVA